MAYCQTTQWDSYAPQVKLTVTQSSSTETTATLSWTLQYIASSAASTNGVARAYTVKIGGATVKNGSYNINGKTGTITIDSGTYTVNKTTAAQSVSFSVSFAFNITWSGTYGGTKSASGSISVAAKTSYTVSYNANGGSGAPSAQTKWHGTALTLSTTKPTRTGYAFQGWATSASGGVAYSAGGSYTGNAAVTLYAVWTAHTYTVSYNANGGSGAPSSQTKTYGKTLTLSSTKPTRTNYKFLGWGTSASATTVSYAAGASYTANAGITLYAVWELAYISPTIYNLSASRCNDSGTVTDDGTCALIAFNWKTTNAVTSIKIAWESVSGGSGSATVTASGTSGSVNKIIGNSALSADASYTITVTVADGANSANSADAVTTLGGSIFPVDFKAGGKGVSFGKPAELGEAESLGGNGVADFAFDAKFDGPVYGKVMGLDKLPRIPAGSDLNDYKTPGSYAVYSNTDTDSIANIPVARAGRLEVSASTGRGVLPSAWSYLRQRFIPYNMENPTFERDISRGDDNVWHYYAWWKSSLTPDASEKVYSKAAMTVTLNANTVLGAVNTYTKIPFDKSVLSTNSRLSLSSNAIRIGANIQYIKVSGQVLVSPGTTNGLRHIRIQKVSGSTTTSVAWSTLYVTASNHIVFALTPIIASVKEGDLLQMVFYTGNSSDSISSGSTANGFETYFTVEEL